MEYQFLSPEEKKNLIEERIHRLEMQHFDHEILKEVAQSSLNPEDIQTKVTVAEAEGRQRNIEQAIGRLHTLLENQTNILSLPT